ncbi:MAG TPA: hypothetical protein VNR87_16460, partial [Flavisolibacter sp.]|nr:hypothetical protein [Flavisolibacter sp.]
TIKAKIICMYGETRGMDGSWPWKYCVIKHLNPVGARAKEHSTLTFRAEFPIFAASRTLQLLQQRPVIIRKPKPET